MLLRNIQNTDVCCCVHQMGLTASGSHVGKSVLLSAALLMSHRLPAVQRRRRATSPGTRRCPQAPTAPFLSVCFQTSSWCDVLSQKGCRYVECPVLPANDKTRFSAATLVPFTVRSGRVRANLLATAARYFLHNTTAVFPGNTSKGGDLTKK